MESLSRFLWGSLSDPDVIGIVRRALVAGVVLDTWMNGQDEEQITGPALSLMEAEQERLGGQALSHSHDAGRRQMPDRYVRALFHELVFSSALFAAQKRKGRRVVDTDDVALAVKRIEGFVTTEPTGLMAAEVFFFVVSAHEDLNAIAYYGRLAREDFLLGNLHRPWSNVVLTAQLDVYAQLNLVETVYTGDGDMLLLTGLGRDVLERLRGILEESGELAWRSENQRWVIFGETNYDQAFRKVFPDGDRGTVQYLDTLDLRPGMKVLEVGCGTGRATVDLGMVDRVGPDGEITALDPSPVLLDRLREKCRQRGLSNVRIVQGMAEALPFPDNTFDAVVSVAALHFTEVDQAVREMTRVTRPGGLVSAACPPPEFDVRRIPMVALWFRPLTDLANRVGVSFSERNGLPVGVLEATFRHHLGDVRWEPLPVTVSAVDYRSFLNFMLRGAALFQNLLCRLPYQERWSILRRLEESGEEIARHTGPEEQQAVYSGEAAYGVAPE